MYFHGLYFVKTKTLATAENSMEFPSHKAETQILRFLPHGSDKSWRLWTSWENLANKLGTRWMKYNEHYTICIIPPWYMRVLPIFISSHAVTPSDIKVDYVKMNKCPNGSPNIYISHAKEMKPEGFFRRQQDFERRYALKWAFAWNPKEAVKHINFLVKCQPPITLLV